MCDEAASLRFSPVLYPKVSSFSSFSSRLLLLRLVHLTLSSPPAGVSAHRQLRRTRSQQHLQVRRRLPALWAGQAAAFIDAQNNWKIKNLKKKYINQTLDSMFIQLGKNKLDQNIHRINFIYESPCRNIFIPQFVCLSTQTPGGATAIETLMNSG